MCIMSLKRSTLSSQIKRNLAVDICLSDRKTSRVVNKSCATQHLPQLMKITKTTVRNWDKNTAIRCIKRRYKYLLNFHCSSRRRRRIARGVAIRVGTMVAPAANVAQLAQANNSLTRWTQSRVSAYVASVQIRKWFKRRLWMRKWNSCKTKKSKSMKTRLIIRSKSTSQTMLANTLAPSPLNKTKGSSPRHRCTHLT